MTKCILLASLLTSACVAAIDGSGPTVDTSAKHDDQAGSADKAPLPPTPVPHIVELAWRWSGCNPAAGNALPFGLVVDVWVDDGTGVVTSCGPDTDTAADAVCRI